MVWGGVDRIHPQGSTAHAVSQRFTYLDHHRHHDPAQRLQEDDAPHHGAVALEEAGLGHFGGVGGGGKDAQEAEGDADHRELHVAHPDAWWWRWWCRRTIVAAGTVTAAIRNGAGGGVWAGPGLEHLLEPHAREAGGQAGEEDADEAEGCVVVLGRFGCGAAAAAVPGELDEGDPGDEEDERCPLLPAERALEEEDGEERGREDF